MGEKLFNRLDGGIIFDWFRKHDNERTEKAAILSNEKPNTEPNPEGQKKVIELMKSALIGSEVKKNEPKGKVKTEYDLVCQEALTEFDKIYNEGKGSIGKKFITVEGKVMDQTEFMEFKINKYLQK